MDEYKILDALWFTNSTINRFTPYDDACIGIVAVETYEPTGEWKAYIGIGAGINSEHDKQQVATYGSGLTPEQAQGFFYVGYNYTTGFTTPMDTEHLAIAIQRAVEHMQSGSCQHNPPCKPAQPYVRPFVHEPLEP